MVTKTKTLTAKHKHDQCLLVLTLTLSATTSQHSEWPGFAPRLQVSKKYLETWSSETSKFFCIYPRTFYLHLETWSSENLKVFLHLPKNMMLFAGTVSTLGLLQKLWWRMSSSERLTRFSYMSHCFTQIMSSTLVTCLPIPQNVRVPILYSDHHFNRRGTQLWSSGNQRLQTSLVSASYTGAPSFEHANIGGQD